MKTPVCCSWAKQKYSEKVCSRCNRRRDDVNHIMWRQLDHADENMGLELYFYTLLSYSFTQPCVA